MISVETTGYVGTESCQNTQREQDAWVSVLLSCPIHQQFKPFGTCRHCHSVRQLRNSAWCLLEHSIVIKRRLKLSGIVNHLFACPLKTCSCPTSDSIEYVVPWLSPTWSQISTANYRHFSRKWETFILQ